MKYRAFILAFGALAFGMTTGCGGVSRSEEAIFQRIRRANHSPQDRLRPHEVDVVRRFVGADRPKEVYAYYYEGPWSGPHLVEILVFEDRAEARVCLQGDREWFLRSPVSLDKLADFRRLIVQHEVDAMEDDDSGPPSRWGWGVFLHLSDKHSTRVYTNNPALPADLGQRFDSLVDHDRMTLTPTVLPPIEGLKVLFAHPKDSANFVWAAGRDIRVRGFKWAKGEHGDIPGWFSLSNGHLGKEVDAPPIWLKSKPHWSTTSPRVVPSMQIHRLNAKPGQPGKLRLTYPVIAPDGSWVVGIADRGRGLTCCDLKRRKYVPIADEEAVDFMPLTYLAAHKKVLLVKHLAKRTPLSLEWTESEYRILDPITGKSTPHRFSTRHPLFQKMPRPFQPTGEPHVIWCAWVAMRNPTDNATLVGRFDMKELRFRKWVQIDGLRFTSDEMWVDSAAKLIYITYMGTVLTIPLPADVFKEGLEVEG